MRKTICTKQSGFTLTEILVVIVIITVLVSIVGINVLHKPGEARVAASRLEMKAIQSAIRLYQTEQGRLPTQEQGIPALVAPSRFEPIPTTFPSGGYLDSPRIPTDPWKYEYIYLVPGRQGEPFELISYGRDGEPGGDGEDADLSTSDG